MQDVWPKNIIESTNLGTSLFCFDTDLQISDYTAGVTATKHSIDYNAALKLPVQYTSPHSNPFRLGVKDPKAKKFAAQTMMTGDAAVGNLKFPQKYPGKPLPGTATSSSNDQKVKPLFEIYLYCPPDAFACIEHNRIEITRRKQQHRLGVENPLPLIPRFTRPSDYSTVGFCVLLRSYSYRLGYVEDSDELAKLGEGPDLLYFNRSFSSTRSVYPRATRIDIGQILMIGIFNNVGRPPERYALDVDEVTNTPKGRTPDIQYLVYALFLSSIRDTAGPSLLESTARLFTTSMFSHLPANKTLTLKFFILKSPSWRRSTPTAKRITPQEPEKYIIIAQGKSCELFRLFTVVLDRAKFVSEAGVYFYIAYLDTSEDPDPSMEDAPDNTQVVRGVDISTVARRLGVVVLDGYFGLVGWFTTYFVEIYIPRQLSSTK
ncbi:hypothetical protein N7467_006021 [Penicillium canescens]|nr:hypothetical protein N7467_006021 [Penicillium canescens]